MRPQVVDFICSIQTLVAHARSHELTIEEACLVAEYQGRIDAILQLEQTLRDIPAAPRSKGELRKDFTLGVGDGCSMEQS